MHDTNPVQPPVTLRTRSTVIAYTVVADDRGIPCSRVEYPDRPLNRLTTFFRAFTIIPIAIVLGVVSGAQVWSWMPTARPTRPRPWSWAPAASSSPARC